MPMRYEGNANAATRRVEEKAWWENQISQTSQEAACLVVAVVFLFEAELSI